MRAWTIVIAAGLSAAAAPAARAGDQTRPPPAAAEHARTTASPAEPEVLVRFEGGDYPSNVPRLLRALAAAQRLETREVTVGPGQGICQLYFQAGLPGGCSRETVALAAALNPGRDLGTLGVGARVQVPVVDLAQHPYVRRLDPAVAGDKRLADDFGRNWKEALLSAEPLPDGQLRLTFQGYQLRLAAASDAEATQLARKLRALRLPNVAVLQRRVTRAELPLHGEPGKFWDDCAERRPAAREEVGTLALLIADGPGTCPVACHAESCPDVVVVDTPVKPHPDLATSLGKQAANVPEGPMCRTSTLDRREYHGTHLAGIVAADGHGCGISGIAPGVRIAEVSSEAGAAAIIEFMERREGEPGFPIYLYASEWKVGQGAVLSSETERFDPNLNPVGAKIVDLRPLWIVAAGDGRGQISKQTVYSPMNLGDQRNVLVITACQECRGPPALIPAWANRSASGQPMVHLAAPGVEIPSTGSETEYVRATGTSQAAAFAAGVAAAMRVCYPDQYVRPASIKLRLQVTARPFPVPAGGPAPDAGITSGILDLETALLDPGTDWLRRSAGEPWAAVKVKRWLRSITLLHPVSLQLTSEEWLAMERALRLVRVPSARTSKREWVVYGRVADDSSHLGEVRRFNAGIIKEDAPILELCDGRQLRPSEVEDLLLSGPVGLNAGRGHCQP